MSLQFTRVPSLACRGGLRKWRADCSTVGLYCVTNMATNLQRFSLYYGSRAFVVWDCWTHLPWHAGNTARQWHADSGKPRAFILCEKKHKWDYSNASTSLKNPLLVRVWPMCPSVKLHLCWLLFTQYKWRGLLEYIYAGLWEYVLIVKALFWHLSAKLYLLWRVFIIHLVNFAKPAWCSNSSKFSVVVSTYRPT